MIKQTILGLVLSAFAVGVAQADPRGELSGEFIQIPVKVTVTETVEQDRVRVPANFMSKIYEGHEGTEEIPGDIGHEIHRRWNEAFGDDSVVRRDSADGGVRRHYNRHKGVYDGWQAYYKITLSFPVDRPDLVEKWEEIIKEVGLEQGNYHYYASEAVLNEGHGALEQKAYAALVAKAERRAGVIGCGSNPVLYRYEESGVGSHSMGEAMLQSGSAMTRLAEAEGLDQVLSFSAVGYFRCEQ